MSLTEQQQFVESIKRSKKPLIVVGEGAGYDGHAAALGLVKVMRKLDTLPDVITTEQQPPKNLRFLPLHDHVKTELDGLRTFVIDLDVRKTKIDELSYEMKDNKLKIYLTPKKGTWNEKDIKSQTAEYRYDLIICLGAPDYEACGKHFNDNPEFFFNTPVINIDHATANEHYAEINFVDMTATAVAEVCHDLIETVDKSLIDEDVATCFLTGMIAKTKSFKTTNVTPKTLQVASRLMEKGARRDDIVHHLFRTRTIPTLKLWGRALARLKADSETNIVWSLLSKQDFVMSGAGEQDLPDVIHELISSSPSAKIVALIYEDQDGQTCGVVSAEKPYDAIQLALNFKPAGTREMVNLCFPNLNLQQTEKELIESLKQKIIALPR